MRIGFLLNDEVFQNIDLSTPELGNPGVGGTEFSFAVLASMLNRTKKITNVIFHFSDNILPPCIDIKMSRIEELQNHIKKNHIDLLVVRNGQSPQLYQQLEKTNVKTIVWAHNYLHSDEAKVLSNNDCIKRIVCVGRQQYDRYIDHDIIKKTTFIYNMLSSMPEGIHRKRNYSPRVTYVGSLIHAKGFHQLAEIWKDILKEVPEAELSVIGSGKLYFKSAKLGKWKVAEESFEKQFRPYLSDTDGKKLDSVHFHGVLGEKKIKIFQDTAVGVINPSANTETFGLGAIEMQSCGIPVVTRKRYGLVDTTKDKITGYLFENKTQFKKYIIRLLTDKNLNECMGENGIAYVNSSFDAEKLTEQWLSLFEDIENGKACTYIKPSNYFRNDYKILRILNRQVRKIFSFVPSIIDWKTNLKIIRRKLLGE